MRWTGVNVRMVDGTGGLGKVDSPLRKRVRVSLCDATHWSSARALQTRFDAAAVSEDGLRRV